MQSQRKNVPTFSALFARVIFPSNSMLAANVPKYPFSVYFALLKLTDPEKQLINPRTGKLPEWVGSKLKDKRLFVRAKVGGTDQRDELGFPAPEKREGSYLAPSASKKYWGPNTCYFANIFMSMRMEMDLKDIIFQNDSDNIKREENTNENFILCFLDMTEDDFMEKFTKIADKFKRINMVNPHVKDEVIQAKIEKTIKELLDLLVTAKVIDETYRAAANKKIEEKRDEMIKEIKANKAYWLSRSSGNLSLEEMLVWNNFISGHDELDIDDSD